MLPTPPSTDPSLIYRYRDSVCVCDALVAAVGGLDLFTEIAKEPTDVSRLAQRLGVAERPLDVIVTLLRALGWLEGGPLAVHAYLARPLGQRIAVLPGAVLRLARHAPAGRGVA